MLSSSQLIFNNNWLLKMSKRYIEILNEPLEYNGEKCTAYQIENAVYLELDQEKVKSEFGEYSICYVIEENNQIKFVNSGDLDNEDEFEEKIKNFLY